MHKCCSLRQNTAIFDQYVYTMKYMLWLCSFDEINFDILFVATPFEKIYEEQIR